jgi:arginine repressor
MKEVQRKKAILHIINAHGAITTAQICKFLEKKGLSADGSTISGMLYKMVQSKELQYGAKTGPLGGKTYVINTERPPRPFEKKTFTIKFPTIHDNNH